MKVINKYAGRILFIFNLLICLSVSVQAEEYGLATVERTKELGGTYSVKNGGKVDIRNMYGGITVSHWKKKNEVEIKVIVTAKAGSEQQAFAILERVNVTFTDKPLDVVAKTDIRSQNNKKGESLDVHYYITAHPDIAMKLDQQYGNINLPDENNTKIDLIVKYGNIRGGDFAQKLDIQAAYSNVTIGDAMDVKFDLAYCGDVNIKNGRRIEVDARYSNIKLNEVGDLKVEMKYGNLSVKEVGSFSYGMKYSDAKIGSLHRELKVSEMAYSNVTVDRVAPTVTSIYASSRYGNLTLSVPEGLAFEVEAKGMKYASFNMNGFDATHTHVEAPSYYKYTIKGGGQTKIRYEGNNYGNLTIRKY